jgi:molybdopterin-guanine dinucleotide biosynthesis protein A
MKQATGFVTAGGGSKRMGEDKALLRLGSRTVIEYVIEALQPVTTGVALIANRPEYQRFGLPVFADAHAGIGPLEAIRTALANSPTPLVILAGCDMPFLSSDLFALLLYIASQQTPMTLVPGLQTPDHRLLTPDFPYAVVPLNEAGLPEPLCAVYATRALETVTGMIDSGVRKVSLLFEKLPCRLVSFAEIRHLENSTIFFENLNTPQDYERARKKIRRDF